MKRADLDGFRLTKVEGPDIWLVFHGARHRIAGPAVYQALFDEADNILLNPDVDEIDVGDEICEGSCLVRFEGRHEVFLATRSAAGLCLLHIETYQSFLDFGFSMQKVRELPALFADVVKVDAALVSAPDRASQGGEVR